MIPVMPGDDFLLVLSGRVGFHFFVRFVFWKNLLLLVKIEVTDSVVACLLGQMKNHTTITEQLSQSLRQSVEETWPSENLPALPQAISSQIKIVQSALAGLGNAAFQLNSSEKSESGEDLLAAFVIHYQWAGQAKTYLILWRDVIFEIQKALILEADGVVPHQSVKKLVSESKQVLSGATEELLVILDRELAAAKTNRSGPEKMITRWRLQKNPWPIYEKQMEELVKQCDEIAGNYETFAAAAAAFEQIRHHTLAFLDACQDEIKKTESLDAKSADLIEEYQAEPGKLAAAIEDLEEQLELRQHLNLFSAELEASCVELPAKIQAFIGVSGGMLQVGEVLIKKRTQQWLDAEIIPVLYEIWELTESAVNGMKMALINIRNRAYLMAAESKETKNANLPLIDLKQPLHFFTASLEKNGKNWF